MKLGIVGTGLIVQEFLPRLVKMEGLEVVGVQSGPHSFDQCRQLCEENGVPHPADSFEALCRLDIDTVYIAVPNFLHFHYCKLALEQGLNVIVEKPMTSSHQEAVQLAELAAEKNCFLFEAVTTLYLKGYQKIQGLLPRIGTVKLVQSQYSQYSRRYDAFRAGTLLPVFDPAKAGGAMMDLNLYNLQFVMGLFGEPQSFQYHANIERDIDTSGILTMEYPGFQALCMAAKDCKGAAFSMIQGTDGSIKTSLPPNVIGTVTLELNDGTREEYALDTIQDRLIPEFQAFIRAVNDKDHAFCRRMLEKSVAVSKVQTQARLQVGVRFPMDQE